MKITLAMAAATVFAVRALAQQPALTIYNKDFAVVRDTVPLDLKEGVNEGISFSGMTATAETDSVILRDPSGKMKLKVVEETYRSDPISKERLLTLNEGKTIDFLVKEPNKPARNVKGKIIRGGSQPGSDKPVQPIIEVDGKKQFTLPGEPLFPDIGDDAILNPTISWKLKSDVAGKCDAQIAYVTGGLSWHAEYNIVYAETGDTIDLVGWVTLENESGRAFKDARVKFMAGEVNKLPPWEAPENPFLVKKQEEEAPPPVGELLPVNEKLFSEYHLYTVSEPVTLHDHETKQMEFVRARGVKTQCVYVYDGATEKYGDPGDRRMELDDDDIPTDEPVNNSVWVLREFKNSEENNLGIPLPAGEMRFFQQDSDGQLECTSANDTGHTSRDEIIRVYTGSSFDLTGERRRTDYKLDKEKHTLDEAFEIKLHNHKKTPVEIRTVEHLMRFANWQVTQKSDTFTKIDSDTIEFRSTLKPNEEKTITYRLHYAQ